MTHIHACTDCRICCTTWLLS